MTAHQNGNIFTEASDFLLNCFGRCPSWQLWLSLPLSLFFLLAMRANTTLLTTIGLETSLHEPMYYMFSLLSLLDMVLCLTVIRRSWPSFGLISGPSASSPASFRCSTWVPSLPWSPARSRSRPMTAMWPSAIHWGSHPSSLTNLWSRQPFLFWQEIPLLFFPSPFSQDDSIIVGEMSLRTASVLMSVSRLSCDDITISRFYLFAFGWALLGSDLILIFLPYTLILWAVLRLKSEGAVAKALSTCGSHFILILFFSTILLVFVLTHVTKKKVSPNVPVLLDVIHYVIPAALTPLLMGYEPRRLSKKSSDCWRKDGN